MPSLLDREAGIERRGEGFSSRNPSPNVLDPLFRPFHDFLDQPLATLQEIAFCLLHPARKHPSRLTPRSWGKKNTQKSADAAPHEGDSEVLEALFERHTVDLLRLDLIRSKSGARWSSAPPEAKKFHLNTLGGSISARSAGWRKTVRAVALRAASPHPSSLVSRSALAYAEDVSDVIGERLSRYLEKTAPAGLVSLYLFGSHAESRSHRESDVDVGVLLDRRLFGTPRARFDERLRLIADLGDALDRNDVDVVILNDVPPGFGARIATRGLRLYCSDPEAAHAFVRDVQLRAADLVPFLRKMRELKLEALKR